MNQQAEAERAGSLIEVPEQSFSRRVPVAQPTQATSLIQAIASAASNPNVNMDNVERLFAMHKEMVAIEAEAAFNAAMARAQEKMLPVVTNRKNTHTGSMYANLGAIAKGIVPCYTSEGLSISFDADRPVLGGDGKPLGPPPNGWFRTVAIVSHSAGHSRLHHIDLPSDEAGVKGNANKTPIQGVISMVTYGRRAITCMVFNVSTEDNDGNGAGDAKGMSEGQLTDFVNSIEIAADEPTLQTLWEKGVAAANAVKDKAAYDAIKKAVATRKEALAKPKAAA